MICEIGNFLILLSMLLLPFQIVSSFSNQFLLTRMTKIHCVLVGIAYFLLVYGFITHDTEILGVLIHSSPQHPFYYQIGATWSYHQGSMLLWTFLMSVVATKIPLRALGFFNLFQFYFLLLLYFKASPFIEVPHGDFTGRGMNPLLEDSALLYHPLFLYMGYILILATWSIVLSNQYFSLKKWVYAAWIFLSLGLISGSFWAFYEVGWGGWWFWDPVENIALIPWLLLLGAFHLFKGEADNSLFLKGLLFLSFMFAFLGVFVVRMGLIRSIHNFTQTADNMGFVFAGLGIIVVSMLVFLKNNTEKKIVWSSKNIPGILGILFVILISVPTFLPLFFEFEVDNIYYTGTIVPLSVLYPIALIFALFSRENLKDHIFLYVAFGILCCILISFQKSDLVPFTFMCMVCMCLGMSIWIKHKKNLGSTISHMGFVIFILGISFNHFLYVEKEIPLRIGETTDFLGKPIQLKNIQISETAHYKAEIAEMKWENVSLYPERRYYKNYEIIRQKVAFSLGVFTTFYVYIVDRIENNNSQKWILKLQYHPLISWIWLGGLLMVLGGVISLYGYKRKSEIRS